MLPFIHHCCCNVEYDVQIKICAEDRDMIPKIDAGLSGTWAKAERPKPKSAWKTDRGFGYMSRYSAQILICFIAYIFRLSIPLRVG